MRRLSDEQLATVRWLVRIAAFGSPEGLSDAPENSFAIVEGQTSPLEQVLIVYASLPEAAWGRRAQEIVETRRSAGDLSRQLLGSILNDPAFRVAEQLVLERQYMAPALRAWKLRNYRLAGTLAYLVLKNIAKSAGSLRLKFNSIPVTHEEEGLFDAIPRLGSELTKVPQTHYVAESLRAVFDGFGGKARDLSFGVTVSVNGRLFDSPKGNRPNPVSARPKRMSQRPPNDWTTGRVDASVRRAAPPPERIKSTLRVRSSREALYDRHAGKDRVEASAFSPKSFKRGNIELLTITLYKRGRRKAAFMAALLADPGAELSGTEELGILRRGAPVRIELVVMGATSEPASFHAEDHWSGKDCKFQFAIQIPPSAGDQVVCEAYIEVAGACVGVIKFVRQVTGDRPADQERRSPAGRLKAYKRVFLSYASPNRMAVERISDVYDGLGIDCFFDRKSLIGGEEWSPRLLTEISEADLFHLFWSREAAQSEWVEKEALHALSQRRSTAPQRPDIRISMLDGPPWAPHPASLNDLNFDDYHRAAMIGYARGDGH